MFGNLDKISIAVPVNTIVRAPQGTLIYWTLPAYSSSSIYTIKRLLFYIHTFNTLFYTLFMHTLNAILDAFIMLGGGG